MLAPDAELRERALLIETLSTDPDRAERLLDELSVARGLGPTRFAALLRRNALLRGLVADDVRISDEVVEGVWDAMHGPTRITRIIAVADLRDATQVRRRLIDGEDFASVAVETSLDASGPRGGRLGPVSRLDPAWPRAFREAMREVLQFEGLQSLQVELKEKPCLPRVVSVDVANARHQIKINS